MNIYIGISKKNDEGWSFIWFEYLQIYQTFSVSMASILTGPIPAIFSMKLGDYIFPSKEEL